MDISNICASKPLVVEEHFLYAEAPKGSKKIVTGTGDVIYHGARRSKRLELKTGVNQNDAVIFAFDKLYVNTDSWERIKVTFDGVDLSTDDVSRIQFNVGLYDGTYDNSIRFQRVSSADNTQIACVIANGGVEGGFILARSVASLNNLAFELTYQRLYCYDRGLYLAGSTDAAAMPFSKTLYPYVRILNTGTDGTEKSLYLDSIKIEYFNS